MNYPQNGFPQYPQAPQGYAPQPQYPSAPAYPPQQQPQYPQQPGFPPQGFHPQQQPQYPQYPQGPAQAPAFDPAAMIAGADAGVEAIYLLDGTYKVRLEKVFQKVNKKGNILYMVEMFILESTNPSRPAHSKASWAPNLSQHPSAKTNVKKFLACALGVNLGDKAAVENQITPAVVSGSMSESNPLGGLVLQVTCQTGPTQSGGEFTKHFWTGNLGKDPSWIPGAVGNQFSPPQATQAPQAFQAPQASPPQWGGAAASPHVPSYGAQAALPPPPNPTIPQAAPAPVAFPQAAPGAPAWGGVPTPGTAPQPPAPAPFNPAALGFQVHTNAPGWFWNPQTNAVKTEAQLRAGDVNP